jgi:RNA polymerase sigma factor (sigma-70 family)
MTTAHAGGLSERWDAVLEHRERALRVARARLTDPYDVDDAVQEGMARVVAMPNLDLDRIGPLLSTVVANVAIDTHRRQDRWARLENKLTTSQITAQPHDEPVCDAAEARWLQEQLASLAPRERAVVELRAEGRSVAETASLLGISYKAVESAFTRGRTALKALWRTTLVGVGALVLRAWRVPNKAVGTTVLAAAVSLVIAVVHLAPSVPFGSHPAGPGSTGVTAASYRSAEPKLVGGPVRPGGAPAIRGPRRPPASTQVRTIAALQAPKAGKFKPAVVTVTKEHDRESFSETLQRCLRNGVTVSPTDIECRG